MLRIDCPCCGPRDHDEFRYGGDASVIRPAPDEPDSDRWYRHVFIRANRQGPHREYWQHVAGCRQWLLVDRNTVTHDIVTVRLAREDVS